MACGSAGRALTPDPASATIGKCRRPPAPISPMTGAVRVHLPDSATCAHSPLRGMPMTETADNLGLEHLRAIRADVAGIKVDVREVKHRLTSLEGAVAGLKRDQAAS